MSQIYVKVEPVPITKVIGEIRLFVASLDFGTSATFSVDSFTIDGELFKRDSVLMDGDAYKAWLNDDTYAVEYVVNALGYEIAKA